ncbi:MAG: rod shape-determining protein RodA [Spirochaetales bacterium]|nr:rod shape-determining protein RodA [Spirochaetales bacterium]
MDRKTRIDYLLVISVFAVSFSGIFTLYTQEVIIEDSEGRWVKQLVFFLLGVVLALLVRRFNYTLLGSYAVPLFAIAMLLLIITLVPFIGTKVKGARSWLRVGPLGFQTSELAKLAYIILMAKYLELKERDIERIPSLFLPFMITLLPMVLIVIQPDLGGAVALMPILMTMLFIAGADILHIGSVLMFFGVSISIPLYIEYYRITLVDPLIDHLSDLGQESLIPAVRILRSDIWNFLEKSVIPAGIEDNDLSYLQRVLGNAGLMGNFREAADSVRGDAGGLLLQLLDNEVWMIILGGLLVVVSVVLFVVRFTQGGLVDYLRKIYIPTGVLGMSILAAMAVHMTFSFKYHQVARVTAFINPDKFPRDLAYQTRASKAAIGSGQLTGRGMFQGDMTMGERPLVPEAQTDFIFTSWSERTGFIGSFLILVLLLIIPLRALQLSFEARDRFGSFLAAGFAAMFFFHTFLNAGIALGLMPVTGLPLSFMSYGGSHMITNMLAVGILLSIYRRKHAN